MANQIKAPINYPIIAGGKIVAGGSVLFGQPNVKPDEDNPSTLKAVYLDAALTQPAQNPQGLSSDGVFDQSDTGILFGSNDTVYSIVIKGANKKELSYIPEYDLSDANAAATAQDAAAAAASSESNALSFKNLTEALYTDFTNRYFGAFSSDPSVDDLGNPPNEGSIYFNSTSNVFFTWTDGAWVNHFPSNPNGLLITATGTTTPRTLGDRFADVVNVKDKGAALDGVTDDSAAFLSAGAGTVFVPSGNAVVLDASSLVGSYVGSGSINGVPVSSFNKHIDLAAQPLQYKLAELDVSSLGISPERFCQGFTFNSKNNNGYLYLRTAGSSDKNDERFRVIQFQFGAEGATLTPVSTTNELASGHQGISIEYRDPLDPSSIYLWTKAAPHLADTASNEQTGKGVYRWDYQGAATTTADRLQLFPDNGSGLPLEQFYNITPCISTDQKYLCVKVSSFGTPTSDQRVFVYDLDVINSLTTTQWLDPSNFNRDSQAYLTDWPLSRAQLRSSNFTQAISCDGDFIYMTCGGNELTPINKDNVVYTLSGDLVGRFNHTLGEPIDRAGMTKTAWEPEGGSILQQGDNQLLTLINTSYDESGTNRVFHEVWGNRSHSTGSISKSYIANAELGSDIHFNGGVPQAISFNDGDNLDFQVITDKQTGEGYLAFRLQDDGAIELHQPDDTSGSRVRRGVGVNREILELRGNTGLADGAAINLYGGTDSVSPNIINFFTQGDSANPDATIDADGRLIIGKYGVLKLGNPTGTTSIARSSGAGREILEIRANETLGQGAGINMYGNGDSANAGNIIITITSGSDLVLQNIPTSAPTGAGKVWNDSGILKIT